YTISGKIVIDPSGNGTNLSSQTPYTGAATLKYGSNTVSAANGVYTFNNVPQGNYTIQYTNPPTAAGYNVTYPQNGVPPSLNVSVGPNCASTLTTNGIKNASCTGGSVQ